MENDVADGRMYRRKTDHAETSNGMYHTFTHGGRQPFATSLDPFVSRIIRIPQYSNVAPRTADCPSRELQAVYTDDFLHSRTTLLRRNAFARRFGKGS